MCHYLGGGLHGRQKRVKAQSESSKSVVNSVLISREMPVFPGFLEIIRVVQVNTERRRKELADCVITRMKYLDDFTLKKVADGTIVLAGIISMYAILKINPFVYDFMNEVYREKAELMINRITDADINQFMDVKSQQVEEVGKWTDGNKERVKGALRNMLIEAGMIRDMGSFYIILVPVMDTDIVKNLREIDGDIYLRAMGISQ